MPPVATVDEGMPRIGQHAAQLALVPPAAWLPLIELTDRGRRWVEPVGIADAPVARARVDAGRWIAECPLCNVPSWVTWRDPRLWCVTCENTAVAGRWVHVEFPADEVREECERVLRVRPPHHQFWTPGVEDVIALMGENVGTLDLPPYEGY